MINCIKTNSENSDFKKLVAKLDAELAVRDGAAHAFYDQFNKIDTIQYVMVAYENGLAVGCGAIKQYNESTMEIKRMYVPVNKRGQGVASAVLQELEQWAVALNYKKCLLETGKKQPGAIELYKKNSYKIIPNFGQYANVDNSVCFEKTLPV